ncbi:MAG: hypothetical protein RKO66_13945 [Candidatus Contendobacter sp.]|nr:hypothetical protein [Candidatus Contendobacter sp.]
MFIYLSKGAWDRSKDNHQCEPSEEILYATREKLPNILSSCKSWACIVVDHNQIDAHLFHLMSRHQKTLKIGLIPYDSTRTTCFASLLEPYPGQDPDKLLMGFYSVTADQYREFGVDNQEKQKNLKKTHALLYYGVNPSPDIMKLQEILRMENLTNFAAVMNGRQTYLTSNSGLTLHSTFSNPSEKRIIVSSTRCKHWLLQSCHSPFNWENSGNFTPIPLAIILNGMSRSAIASVRLQTFTPGLLNLYRELSLLGYTLGEISQRLNLYVSKIYCDDQAFILFGHPNTRIAKTNLNDSNKQTNELTQRNQLGISLISEQEIKRSHMAILRVENLLLNLSFLSDSYLWRHSNQGRERRGYIANITHDSLRSFYKKISKIARNPSIVIRPENALSIVKSVADSINNNFDLEKISIEFKKFWQAQVGYYYSLDQISDSNYLPEKAELLNDEHPVWGEGLVRKSLVYFGVHPTQDFKNRIQLVSPKHLMAMDVSSIYEKNIKIELEQQNRSLHIKATYTNLSGMDQWVDGFIQINDPNNISANSGKQISKLYLEKLKLTYKDYKPSSLSSGECATCQIDMEDIPEDIFYLLIEFNFFVDYCWNWCSFVWRSLGIDTWVNSSEYNSTLP